MWESSQPDFYEESILTFLRERRGTMMEIGGVTRIWKVVVDILPARGVFPVKNPLAGRAFLEDLEKEGIDVDGLVVEIPAWPVYPIPSNGWSSSFGAEC